MSLSLEGHGIKPVHQTPFHPRRTKILATCVAVVAATGLAFSPARASCDKETITHKSSDGAYIETMEGRRFIVSSYDRFETAIWLPLDDVVVCGEGRLVTIFNDNDKVEAQEVK